MKETRTVRTRRGHHRFDGIESGERPDYWPDELCERCIAPDCNHIGPLWTCPYRKRMLQEEVLQ